MPSSHHPPGTGLLGRGPVENLPFHVFSGKKVPLRKFKGAHRATHNAISTLQSAYSLPKCRSTPAAHELKNTAVHATRPAIGWID